LQAIQTCYFSKTGISSLLFIEIDHSRLDSLFLRNGRARIQAPAWGAAQQRILALFKRFDDEARVLKHSESIAKDRSFWLVGAVGG